jgi:hypothetical protein
MQPIVALVPMRSRRAVVLVHRTGALTLLMPKGLAAQISAITQRKHYRAAVGVAEDTLARLTAANRTAEAEETRELIADVEAKFATHLFERAGEPEAAMQHYVRTIGFASCLSCLLCMLVLWHIAVTPIYLRMQCNAV